MEKLKHIDELQKFLSDHPFSKDLEQNLKEDFNLNYTYHSNAIEGNTLTLMETKVVLEGVTIGGKTLREHFEVINHHQAISYIESLVKDKSLLNENDIKSIHSLILKNIDDENAGKYRSCNVRISGAIHIPPTFFEVPMQMQDFAQWCSDEALTLHPVIRASRTHAKLVGIHPFIDGNGRTSRLVMNLELLKSNLPAINIKSDQKMDYFQALDVAHTTHNYEKFDDLVVDYVLKTLQEKKQIVLDHQIQTNHKTTKINQKRR